MFWHPDIDPAVEPAKVLLKRGDFVDGARDDRTVPFKVYHPVDHNYESLPLVMWSHGFGGNRDGASFISRFLAAHGFVVVHITHRGTDSSLWEGKPEHPWDILRKAKVTRETTIDRFMDVPFALDSLQGWMDENPEIGDLIDWDNIGMSGHSFGAMTAQVMAGMRFPGVDAGLRSLKEDRFKAGILYSPVPIRHLSDAPNDDLYGPIDIPLLHMTGTDDDSPIEDFDYKDRLAVHDHSTADEKHVLILQDGDHMVYNGTRGKLKENPNRDRHEEIVKVTALAYWLAHLRGDENARDWLSGAGVSNYIAANGTYEAIGA